MTHSVAKDNLDNFVTLVTRTILGFLCPCADLLTGFFLFLVEKSLIC